MRTSLHEERSEFWVKLFNGLYLATIVPSPLVAMALKVRDMPASWGLLANVVSWIDGHAWIAFVLPIVAGVSKFLAERLARRWIRDIVGSLLNRVADELFDGLDGDSHYHRATLFAHRWWKWDIWSLGWGRFPWSGWLVPVARSGHTTQKSRSRYLAPDDADRCEGVAGKTWARDKELHVRGLPHLTKDSSPADIQKYAEGSWIRTQEVEIGLKGRRAYARSFLGLPIEVRGKKWGVLVFDSRAEDAFGQQRPKSLPVFLFALGKLLERSDL